MIRNEHIKISNIYHMLCYVFTELEENGAGSYQLEQFTHVTDVFAALLTKGLGDQIRRGLTKGYHSTVQELAVPRGKIVFAASLALVMRQQRKLYCEVDHYAEQTLENQIFKTVLELLAASAELMDSLKVRVRRLLPYFSRINRLDPVGIQWRLAAAQSHRSDNGKLLRLCRLLLEGMLMTEEEGTYRLATYLDHRAMHQLFEQFVLNYYRKHYPQLKPASAYVPWNVDDQNRRLLPRMKTDLILWQAQNCLIIDTKYYEWSLQRNRFDSYRQHSANLYQMFAYVKNQDIRKSGQVKGLVLYAKTENNELPDEDYQMSGNLIYIRSLDLGRSFHQIEKQLRAIAGLIS